MSIRWVLSAAAIVGAGLGGCAIANDEPLANFNREVQAALPPPTSLPPPSSDETMGGGGLDRGVAMADAAMADAAMGDDTVLAASDAASSSGGMSGAGGLHNSGPDAGDQMNIGGAGTAGEPAGQGGLSSSAGMGGTLELGGAGGAESDGDGATLPLNLLINSTFATDLSGWVTELNSPAAGIIHWSPLQDGIVKADLTAAGDDPFDSRIYQDVGVQTGKSYTLAVKLRLAAAGRQTVEVLVNPVAELGARYILENLTLTGTNWENVSSSFTALTTEVVRVQVWMGNAAAGVRVDDFTFTEE